jgi:hypothetical protein
MEILVIGDSEISAFQIQVRPAFLDFLFLAVPLVVIHPCWISLGCIHIFRSALPLGPTALLLICIVLFVLLSCP